MRREPPGGLNFYIIASYIFQMFPYIVDFQRIKEKIRDLGFTKVLVQLPEGMKIYAWEIKASLSPLEVFVSTKPCYGACDIEVYNGMATLQIGHSEIPNINYPQEIIFAEAFANVSFREVLGKYIEMGKPYRRLGLVTSVQHINALQEVKEFLEDHGYEAFIGNGDGRIKYAGQILGCNFSTARNIANNVDAYLFLGTGKFHAMGVEMVTGKKVFVLDPYSSQISEVSEKVEHFIRQRYGAIARVSEAKRFGIIVSKKIGQRRLRLAEHIKDVIENAGRESLFLLTEDINPEEMYYDVDAYVNTACPRVSYDDYMRFPKVIVTPIELEIALSMKKWERFMFDEIVEVD